jgi:chitinase
MPAITASMTTSDDALPTDTTSLSTEMTTSTVYTTNVYTVTQCPPEVECPVGGYVTTETVALYTTVCPVSEVEPTGLAALPDVETPDTITTLITSIYTITACPETVTNCPLSSVTTEVITSTYYPGAHETGSKGVVPTQGGAIVPETGDIEADDEVNASSHGPVAPAVTAVPEASFTVPAVFRPSSMAVVPVSPGAPNNGTSGPAATTSQVPIAASSGSRAAMSMSALLAGLVMGVMVL